MWLFAFLVFQRCPGQRSTWLSYVTVSTNQWFIFLNRSLMWIKLFKLSRDLKPPNVFPSVIRFTHQYIRKWSRIRKDFYVCKKYVISKFTKDLLFNFSTSFKVQYNCIWPLANLLLWPYVFFPTLAKKLFFLFKLPCLKSSNWDNAESKWAFSRTALSQFLQKCTKTVPTLQCTVQTRWI